MAGADRIETAQNITLVVSKGGDEAYPGYRKELENSNNGETTSESGATAEFIEVPISRLDTSKEVEINEVREGTLKANGYTITNISYSGTMTFKGSKITKQVEDSLSDDDKKGSTIKISSLLYTNDGVPKPVTITVQHDLNGETEVYENVMVTSESYEARTEEATETAFDFVAMDRRSDQA